VLIDFLICVPVSVWLKREQILTPWIEKDYQNAINAYKRYENDPEVGLFKYIAHSYLKIGQLEEASKISLKQISNYMDFSKNRADSIVIKWRLGIISEFYSIINKQEEALGYLERTINAGWLNEISYHPILEPLFDHPRFQELVEKQKKKREEVMALVATYNFPEPEDL